MNIRYVSAVKPNASPSYSVSKAGVLGLTRHAAVKSGPRGILANSVCLGFIRTPLFQVHYASSELMEWRADMVPLRRLGLTNEVASAVVCRTSDTASFVTDQALIVDGGLLETPLMLAPPAADQYGVYGR